MGELTLLDNVAEGIREDKKFWNTRVIFKNPYTGKVLYTARNKLILPGSGLIAHKIFDIGTADDQEEAEITPSYDDKIPNIVTFTAASNAGSYTGYNTRAKANDKKILVFCVGTDGCGAEASQVYSVNYKKWCDYTKLVPFKYVTPGDEDAAVDRKMYYGKASMNDRYAYYFKRFDNYNTSNYGVTFKQVYENGTNITSSVYDSTSPEEIYTYVELHMSITEEDCVDYIRLTNGSNKVNTIQLCTCYPVMGIDNNLYMNDIRPITKLNFSNELLSNNKAIDITYQIYF